MAKNKKQKSPEQKRLHALDQRAYILRKKINSGKLNQGQKNTAFNKIRDINRERNYIREEIGIKQKLPKGTNKKGFISEFYTAWEFSGNATKEIMNLGSEISTVNGISLNKEPEKVLSMLNDIASKMTSKQTAKVQTNFNTNEIFVSIVNEEDEDEEENDDL